jgi:hypothetical protein
VTATGTTWTIAPHAGVLDLETSATAGPYFYAVRVAETGAVTAANATNPRIDIVYVQVNDPAEGDGSSTPAVVSGYLAGTAAASPVAPSAPNSRCLILAQILVPKSGTGSPSVTWVAPTYNDTGLVTVTYGPGVTFNTYPLQYQVKNGVCYISGDAKLTSGSMAALTQFNITGAGAFPSPLGGQTATERLVNCGNATSARTIITASGQLILVTGAASTPNVNLAGAGPYVVA